VTIPAQAQLLAIITRELTRLPWRFTGKANAEGKPVFYKPPSDRRDRAEIIEKAMVTNSAYTRNKLVCPFLDKEQRYVGFNGNFRRHHGRGYVPREWLERMGYENTWPNFGGILADLAVLAEKFDLVVMGRHHASSRWYSLQEMQELLETGYGHMQLRATMLRIYAPEDFLSLWRYRFAQWLGFSWIPGAECPFPTEPPQPGLITNSAELRAWMKEHGVTQVELAKRAKVRRQTISENLHGRPSRAKFWEKISKAVQSWA
jgi:hypothetical protein